MKVTFSLAITASYTKEFESKEEYEKWREENIPNMLDYAMTAESGVGEVDIDDVSCTDITEEE